MSTEDMLGMFAGVNAQGARVYNVSWSPNGSSAPTTFFGFGFASVAYVSGSIIKFTMSDAGWIRCLAFFQGVKCAAGGAGQGFHLELDTTNTNFDTGTIAFAIVNGSGTRADIAADANTTLFATVILSKEYGDA